MTGPTMWIPGHWLCGRPCITPLMSSQVHAQPRGHQHENCYRGQRSASPAKRCRRPFCVVPIRRGACNFYGGTGGLVRCSSTRSQLYPCVTRPSAVERLLAMPGIPCDLEQLRNPSREGGQDHVQLLKTIWCLPLHKWGKEVS